VIYTREGIGDLHIDPEDTNSEKTEDNKKKANILSDYFSSVFTNVMCAFFHSFRTVFKASD
jgi:hypothetical protein